MLDKEYFATIMIIFICCTKYSIASKCSAKNPCKFGGRCFAGRCICGASCRDKGLTLLCGEDQNHYMNYCFLKMRSCELQREVKIRCVGSCSSCSAHEISSDFLSSQGQMQLFLNSGSSVCDVEDEYCFNFGLCVTSFGVKTCICPRGYTGERCERKKHSTKPPKSRPLLAKGRNERDKSETLSDTSLMIKLVLSLMMVMGFGIIASALFYRNKVKKLKISRETKLPKPGTLEMDIYSPVHTASERGLECSRDSSLLSVVFSPHDSETKRKETGERTYLQ